MVCFNEGQSGNKGWKVVAIGGLSAQALGYGLQQLVHFIHPYFSWPCVLLKKDIRSVVLYNPHLTHTIFFSHWWATCIKIFFI